jgi:hypothetical protein
MNYATAKEFAEQIKKAKYQYQQPAEDFEIRMKALEKFLLETFGEARTKSEDDFNELQTRYHEVVEHIMKQFYGTLPMNIKEKFERHFYFSTVENRHINAHIYFVIRFNVWAATRRK